MKLFFKKTYYFWILSRALLIIAYAFTIEFSNNQAYEIGKTIVNILIAVMILLMTTIFVFDFFKKHVPFLIKLIPGIFNILFGLLLFFLVTKLMKKDFILLVYLVPVWIISYGVFEITSIKKIRF